MTVQPIGLLVADAEYLVRAGLSSLVAPYRDLRVVAEAGNTAEILESLRAADVHVVLMGGRLSDARAGRVTAFLREAGWSTPVLVLGASYYGPQQVAEVVRSGAAGFLPMTIAPNELATAIRQVHAGKAVFQLDPSWGMHLVSDGGTTRVTPRERQVLDFVERGMSNRQIGMELGIAMRTVDKHVENLMRKFAVRDRRGLVLRIRQVAS